MSGDTPAGWAGILWPDERILWQGRPDGRFRINGAQIAVGLFGLGFAGFAALWMAVAVRAGGIFWAFGLLHFAIGCGIMLAALFGGLYVRRRTWYTLTTQRAFIATELPLTGRTLRDYPIAPDTQITFVDGALSSIRFATVAGRVGRSQPHRHRRTYTTPIGFENLTDGRHVLDLFHQIKRDQTPDKGPLP